MFFLNLKWFIDRVRNFQPLRRAARAASFHGGSAAHHARRG